MALMDMHANYRGFGFLRFGTAVDTDRCVMVLLLLGGGQREPAVMS